MQVHPTSQKDFRLQEIRATQNALSLFPSNPSRPRKWDSQLLCPRERVYVRQRGPSQTNRWSDSVRR